MVPPRGRSKENVMMQASARAVYVRAESPSFIDEGLGARPLCDISHAVEETIRNSNSTRHGRAGILYWLSLVLG